MNLAKKKAASHLAAVVLLFSIISNMASFCIQMMMHLFHPSSKTLDPVTRIVLWRSAWSLEKQAAASRTSEQMDK